MLTIRKDQITAMRQVRVNTFKVEGDSFLARQHGDWYKGRSAEERADFLDTMAAFAQEHQIQITANFLALLQLQVKHQFAIPLAPKHQLPFTDFSCDETYRTQQLQAQFQPDTEVQWIELDADIEELKKAYE